MASPFLHQLATSTINQHFAENKPEDDNIVAHCAHQYSALVHHTVYGIIILIIWVLMGLMMSVSGGWSSTTWKYVFIAVGLMGIFLVVTGVLHGVLTPGPFAIKCGEQYIMEKKEAAEMALRQAVVGRGIGEVHPASLGGGSCSLCATGGCPSCSGGCGGCSGGCPSCAGGNANGGLGFNDLINKVVGPIRTTIDSVKTKVATVQTEAMNAKNTVMGFKNDMVEMAGTASQLCGLVPPGAAQQSCMSISEKIKMMDAKMSQLSASFQPLVDNVQVITNAINAIPIPKF